MIRVRYEGGPDSVVDDLVVLYPPPKGEDEPYHGSSPRLPESWTLSTP